MRTSLWLFRLALLAIFASLLSGFIQVSRGAQQQDLTSSNMFRVGIPYTHADSPSVGSGGDGSGNGEAGGEGSCSASGSACDGSGCSAGGGGSSSTS